MFYTRIFKAICISELEATDSLSDTGFLFSGTETPDSRALGCHTLIYVNIYTNCRIVSNCWSTLHPWAVFVLCFFKGVVPVDSDNSACLSCKFNLGEAQALQGWAVSPVHMGLTPSWALRQVAFAPFLSSYKVKVSFFLQSDGLLCLAEVRACIVISALIAQQRFRSI